MGQIDPVILQLIAENVEYNRRIADSVNKSDAGFRRMSDSADRMAKNIGTALRTVTVAASALAVAGIGAVVASLVASTKAGLDYAASLGNVAKSLGVTTKFLQEFRYAATSNGATVKEADGALAAFSKSLGDAFNGKSKSAVAAVTNLKLSLEDLKRSSETDRFLKVADAIAAIKDPAQQASRATDLFKGSATAILPTLIAGAEAYRKQAQEAAAFGLILSDGKINNADQVANKIERLNKALEARLADVVSSNAQAIGQLAEALAKVAEYAIKAGQQFLGFANIARSKGFISALGTFDGNDLIKAATPAGQAQLGADLIKQQRPRVEKLRASLQAALRIDPTGQSAVPQFLTKRLNEATAKLRTGREMLQGAAALSRPSDTAAPRDSSGITPVAGPKGPKGPDLEQITRHFNDEMARAQIEILRSMADLSGTIDDRAKAELAAIEVERQAANNDAQHFKGLDSARKAQLIAENDKVAAARAAVVQQRLESEQRKRVADIANVALDIDEEHLRSQLDFARTAKERLDIETSLIAIAIERKKIALQLQLADEKDLQRKKAIQDQIDALGAQGNAQQRAAEKRNQGPLGKFIDDIPRTAEEINEALQNVAVDGLRSLNDGLADAIANSKDLGDVFKNVANQIVADLLRIAIQQTIIKPLATLLGGGDSGGGGDIFGSIGRVINNIGGGIFGRASGGYVGPGQTVRVNEHRGAGVELLRMGSQGGQVIPLGQVNAAAAQPAAAAQGAVTVSLMLSDDIDARIVRTSGPVAVEVLRAGAPSIIDAAEQQTLINANRFTI
ncbi:MAG: hypothetical protein V4530_06085 [Pseudomonadota bacterium]